MKHAAPSRRFSFLVLGLFLSFALAWPSAAQTPQRSGMIGASSFVQQGSPAIINRVTPTPNDLLAGGTIKNIGTKTITGYRIGWIAAGREEPPTVKLGIWINVPEGIAAGQTHDLLPQRVAPISAQQEARDLVFFVAEVKFAEAEVWKADSEKLKEQFLFARRRK